MKKKYLLIPALVAMLSVCGCTMIPGELELPSEVVLTSEEESSPYTIEPGSWDAPAKSSEVMEEPPVNISYNYDFSAHNPNEWQTAYYEFLQEMPKSVGDDTSFMSENYYFLADIDDKFGEYVPELCIRTGTCEADYELEIYTFDTKSKEVDQLVGPGVIGAGHSTFYVAPNGNLLADWGHMGYQSVIEFSDISGKVSSEEIFSEDLNGKPGDVDYTTMSEIFGEEMNACMELPVSNPAGLIWYLNLPYPTTTADDRAKFDSNLAFDKCLNNNAEVYVVKSSPYEDCKEGVMPFNDILKPGVLDAYDTHTYKLSTYCYTDVNFDGQDEMLIQITSEGKAGDNDYKISYVLLSCQEGAVYAYSMPYLSTNGNVFVVHYSVYRNWVTYQTVQGFIFDKDCCTFVYSDQEIKDPEKNTAAVWQTFHN